MSSSTIRMVAILSAVSAASLSACTGGDDSQGADSQDEEIVGGASQALNEVLSVEEWFQLVAQNSGKCLEFGNMADGTNLKQQACTSATSQRFGLLDHGDGYFQIQNQASGKCVVVSGGSVLDGAALQQGPCDGGDKKLFSLGDAGNGISSLVNKKSGKCADVASGSTANGVTIKQLTCASGDKQSFLRKSSDPLQALALQFAPRLRFDGAATDYPMSAQAFYDEAVVIPEPAGTHFDNGDVATITNGRAVTYYEAVTCGSQVRITYWWFYGFQPSCDGVSGSHNGDWEQVMVTLKEDQSSAAAVTFWLHGDRYTKLAGDFAVEDTTHPVVYVGKTSHASYFTQGGSGSCLAWEDFHNNWSGTHMDSRLNLVSLAYGSAPWMAADALGSFTWGGDFPGGEGPCMTHPTNNPPTCDMPACQGEGHWHTDCKFGDGNTGSQCENSTCPPGFTDWGYTCVKNDLSQSYSQLYDYSYAIPTTDTGLTVSAGWPQ